MLFEVVQLSMLQWGEFRFTLFTLHVEKLLHVARIGLSGIQIPFSTRYIYNMNVSSRIISSSMCYSPWKVFHLESRGRNRDFSGTLEMKSYKVTEKTTFITVILTPLCDALECAPSFGSRSFGPKWAISVKSLALHFRKIGCFLFLSQFLVAFDSNRLDAIISCNIESARWIPFAASTQNNYQFHVFVSGEVSDYLCDRMIYRILCNNFASLNRVYAYVLAMSLLMCFPLYKYNIWN